MAFKRQFYILLIQQTFSGLDPIAHVQLNIAVDADRAAYLEDVAFGIIAFADT